MQRPLHALSAPHVVTQVRIWAQVVGGPPASPAPLPDPPAPDAPPPDAPPAPLASAARSLPASLAAVLPPAPADPSWAAGAVDEQPTAQKKTVSAGSRARV